MPLLSRLYIRASLIYFAIGITIGALILIEKGTAWDPQLWRLLPVHIELVLLGWMLQLVMGVAYWILPRSGLPPVRKRPALATAAFVLLNLGILLHVYDILLVSGNTLLFISRLLELIALLAFLVHIWPRVKPFGEG